MTATLLDILMILALGLLAGTGCGLLAGFVVHTQKREWAHMERGDRITTLLLILACSSAIMAVLVWYVFFSSAP